jgi:sorting nexin-8
MDYPDPDADSHPWGDPSAYAPVDVSRGDAAAGDDDDGFDRLPRPSSSTRGGLPSPYDDTPSYNDDPVPANHDDNDAPAYNDAPLPASPRSGSGTSSPFTMPSQPASVSPPRQASVPAPAPAPGWSYFDGRSASGFGESPLASGGGSGAHIASPFGSPPVYNPQHPQAPAAHARGGGGSSQNPQMTTTTTTRSATEEHVVVALMPEKEGMFLFQHHNYEVTSPRRNSKVIRRYSDFVWLLDCLHKRYPFRMLPLLPPKRVAGEWGGPRAWSASRVCGILGPLQTLIC